MEPLVLLMAFAAGLLIRRSGYPPLIGYLLAGFAAHALSLGDAEALKPLADTGIVLLLFTIGLKLRLKNLAPRYVWGSALLHMATVIPLTTATILVVGLFYEPLSFDSPITAWTLAFALSFSSTVLAVKMFDERGEANSFYAAIAIGILIVQDILAVAYLVVSTGHYPTPWALALLALPLLILPVRRLLDGIGHGELLLLFGFMAAMLSAELFEWVQLKGGLGALVAGTLIGMAHRKRAKELHEKLAGMTNLLLIGFFLQIGYYGIPSLPMLLVAAVLTLLIVLRPLIYFSLFVLFRLRARTAWLSSLSLFNYSEFGLIIAAIAVESGVLPGEWLTTIALALSLSFLVATPVNKRALELYRRYHDRLKAFESPHRLPEEEIRSLGDADTVVLGMGRIGRGVYRTLVARGRTRIVGIEENFSVTQRLCRDGFRTVHGDASDRDFWERTGLAERDLLVVSLSNHRENMAVVQLARELGFHQTLVVAARFSDQRDELVAMGCNAFYLYEEVGPDFAAFALSRLPGGDVPSSGTVAETDASVHAADDRAGGPLQRRG